MYTGQQFDGVYTELYNLRARQYDPSNGRFTSRDKWAYDYQNPYELNRYVYTANNPATYTDPSGYSIAIENASINSSNRTATLALNKPLKSYRDGFVKGALGEDSISLSNNVLALIDVSDKKVRAFFTFTFFVRQFTLSKLYPHCSTLKENV